MKKSNYGKMVSYVYLNEWFTYIAIYDNVGIVGYQ